MYLTTRYISYESFLSQMEVSKEDITGTLREEVKVIKGKIVEK